MSDRKGTYHDARGGIARIKGVCNICSPLVRFEPCIVSATALFVPTSAGPGPAPAGAQFGSTGASVLVRIEPLPRDNGDDGKLSPVVFDVDPGLIHVPFPATISMVWPDSKDVDGNLTFRLQTFAPGRRPGGAECPQVDESGEPNPFPREVQIRGWKQTRYLSNNDTIALPDGARSVSARSDVMLSLFGGVVTVVGGTEEYSVVGSPDLKVTFLPSALATGARYTPIVIRY